MIEKYYFLFGLAIIWMIYAVVQDVKTTEVSNWLNYSLLAFVLAYRAIYSAYIGEWSFLGFGLLGFGLFFVLANIFYYTKAVGGGDARLLMALGAIIPFESYSGLLYEGFSFVFIMLSIGAVYSLGYSLVLLKRNFKGFKKSFSENIRSFKTFFLIIGVFVLLSLVLGVHLLIFGIVLLLVIFLYSYLYSLERCCMVKLTSPWKLMEGDWLDRSVKVRGKIMKKSVHGLSEKNIRLLRKAKKKVWVKTGIPFVPAIFISFLVMVFFWVVLRQSLFGLISLLFS